MNKYFDKNGREVVEGDILKYDEGTSRDDDYGKSIELVVAEDGELFTVLKIGFPRWSVIPKDSEENYKVELKYYYRKDYEIIGNIKDNPELISPETAAKFWS